MDKKYRAFISYSHLDSRWAAWLHRGLEAFRIPQRLRDQSDNVLPARLAPIFRDREELASEANLSARISAALADSDALIVICSPNSADSRWVNQEILEFKRLGCAGQIYCLIVAGEPGASEIPGREGEECFAPALRRTLGPDGELGADRAEPIAADVRPGGDGKANARLKIIAGLLNVGFDQLRQREQVRRQRRLMAFSAASLSGLLLTGFLAVSAVRGRKDAERRQESAEYLIGFMLGDLTQKLRAVGRLDVFNAIGDEALKYFESLPEEDRTARTLAQRADALSLIGEMAMDQGRLDDALRAFDESVKQAQALAALTPDDAGAQSQLSSSELWLGSAYWQRGDLGPALDHFRFAHVAAERAGEISPNDVAYLNALAGAKNNIAQVLERQGDLQGARQEYEALLNLQQRILELQPESLQAEVDLGFAHNTLGKVELQLGNLDATKKHYIQDLAIKRNALASDPTNRLWQRYLAISEGHMAEILELTGDLDTAIRHAEDSIALSRELVNVEPDYLPRRRFLANQCMRLGRLARMTGDYSAALRLQEGAQAELSTLAKLDPSDSQTLSWLAVARSSIAETLGASGDGATAISESRTALADFDSLSARDGSNLLAQAEFARGEVILATLLEASRDGKEAHDLYRSALDRLEVLSDSADPYVLHTRVVALIGLKSLGPARDTSARLLESGYRQADFIRLVKSLALFSDLAELPEDSGTRESSAEENIFAFDLKSACPRFD